MWSYQSEGEKKQRDVIREIMEYLFHRYNSDWLNRPGLLTTSPLNATIPLRHDLALTLISLSGPKGIHTMVYNDLSRQLWYSIVLIDSP